MADEQQAPDLRARTVGLARALRPRQWAKNVLVFAAPVAAGKINTGNNLQESILAFVAFCLAASGTYLLNDARDVESDRKHPVKRNRPIAAGLLPIGTAYAIGVVLIVAALAIGFATTRDLGVTLVAYLALTTAYSFGLKRVPILDIVAVSAGFVLRAIAGATATGLPISAWFFIVTSFGALLVVVGKREGELSQLGEGAGEVRATLGVYTENFLRYLRSVATGVVLVAYCLWAFDSASSLGADPTNASVVTTASMGSGPGSFWFQLSIVPFAIAIFQYGLVLEQGGGEHPEKVLTSNRGILASGAIWAIIYAYAVYRT